MHTYTYRYIYIYMCAYMTYTMHIHIHRHRALSGQPPATAAWQLVGHHKKLTLTISWL